MKTLGLRLAWLTIWLLALSEAAAARDASVRRVRAFVLAGQSNMVGQGVVDLDHPEHYNGGRGTLARLLEDPEKRARMAHLQNSDGTWVERDDVWVRYRTKDQVKKGHLSIGFTGYDGRHHMGPELQLGHVLGEHFDEPVLLIKTAWGGKSLVADFRPPSCEGPTGPYYEQMIAEVHEALANLGSEFPELAGAKIELTGFVWLQGWNDMIDAQARAEYADNLAHLIRDVRRDLRQLDLPVVVGELGNGGPDAGAGMLEFRRAQMAGATRPEFEGTVAFVETTSFARPAEDSPNRTHGHHWFGNAESYFLIGDALGRAMVDLLKR
ncbi:MAG: sialate O-acetylesterase [Planctomycetota bacterium]